MGRGRSQLYQIKIVQNYAFLADMIVQNDAYFADIIVQNDAFFAISIVQNDAGALTFSLKYGILTASGGMMYVKTKNLSVSS